MNKCLYMGGINVWGNEFWFLLFLIIFRPLLILWISFLYYIFLSLHCLAWLINHLWTTRRINTNTRNHTRADNYYKLYRKLLSYQANIPQTSYRPASYSSKFQHWNIKYYSKTQWQLAEFGKAIQQPFSPMAENSNPSNWKSWFSKFRCFTV